ncbi:hypothetical protein ASE36_10830 [Rhizobium sp. Root274]|uniref:hypothetical protein n=1 Tax=unclassified Rhizobium TaxID=2613769 RepID=UPI000714D04C|nr:MULTISPECIES: hypothetical protein [unclassified Rhizobium]KQW28969.1 hypothetical protein ASC71_10850 [Rhizobium sp. Root1240]KRD29164.1 hypothetical protein ASE36_10830 [Rhizobium sp. Root274]
MLLPLLLLSACNSTEVLTPRADVGNGAQPAGYGEASPVAAAGVQSVQSAPLDQPGSSYSTAPRGPQNTLEAQAAALAQGGVNPVASPPLENGQSQEFPSAPQAAASTRATANPQQQQQPAAQSASTSQPSAGTVRFLPIIGAPVQAVTPLSRQLGAEARARGLTIKSANDATSEHILKGYFSAFSDGGNVTVTYVWDVLDANGGRLHRIQGQEVVPSAAKDPWAAVPASVMQQIATKSMAEYVAWKNGRAG